MIRLREISVQLNIRECFFRTLIERIWRILQVCGTCFIKGKILVPWQDKWDLRRILVWGQVWGEKVCPHTYPHTIIRLKSHLSRQGTIQIKRKSKDKSKRKNQKTNPWKDSVKNPWCSVSVFWFKLCSRRLTERKAAILSIYNIYIIGIWIYISLAIIRSVSLRLQNEGQKKLTDRTDAHGVFDTDFFDLCLLIYIWILNGFASVTACGCWENEEWRMKNVECRNNVRRSEGKPIIQFRVYCPKESKCHALARFVLFVRLVFEKKHSRMISWALIFRIKRII